MVRRSGVLTGIGNSDPELMDGQSTGNPKLDAVINECAKDCYETFFKGTEMDYDGIDAGADVFGIRFGIEPAYFGDNLKVINFLQNKARCTYETGHAFGYYGSGIRSKVRHYESYTRSTKFTRFIDKWHSRLFDAAVNGLVPPDSGVYTDSSNSPTEATQERKDILNE